MKKTTLLLILFWGIINIINAKNYETKILPPEVASLFYDIERPVSKASGKLGVNIPIYTCNTPNISVPISLAFNTSGIKHTQKASSVGLGWSLNAGGFITRVVKGLPDETNESTASLGTSVDEIEFCFENKNYPYYYMYSENYRGIQTFFNPYFPYTQTFFNNNYNNGEFTDEFLVLNAYTFSQNNYLDQKKKYLFDQEPDVYYYSFGGYSGQFILNPTTHEPILLPYSNIKITPVLSDRANINKWTIVTPDGLKYIFEEKDSIHVKSYNLRFYYDDEMEGKAEDYVSTWKLTEIQNQNNCENIKFLYKKQTTSYQDYDISVEKQFIQSVSTSFNTTKINHSMYGNNITIDEHLIDKITFNNNRVEFNYSSRQDIENTQKLENIKVYNSNGCVYTYKFNYDYYSSSSETAVTYLLKTAFNKVSTLRLKLNSMSQYDNNDTLTTKFDYYYPNGFNAQCLNTAASTDNWGFTSEYPYPLYSILTDYSLDNYVSFKNNCGNPIIGLVKEIQHPTGGSEYFEYEKNTYYNQTKKTDEYAGGARIYRITKKYTNGNETKRTYSYDIDGHSSGTLFREPQYYSRQEFYDIIKNIAAKNELEYTQNIGSCPTITIDSEDITIPCTNTNSNQDDDTFFNRVESVSNYPKNSVNDLSDNNVYYSRVTEKMESNKDGMGYNEYFFTSFSDHPDDEASNYRIDWYGGCFNITATHKNIKDIDVYGISCPGNYYILGNSTYKGWERGLLTKQNIYNNNGNLVKQIRNDYDFTNYSFGELMSTEATANFDQTILVSKFKYISALSPLIKTTTIDYIKNDSI
jgi:hypothetical protein